MFKIGKWNPNTKIVEKEIEKSTNDSRPIYTCCLACNLRNIYRAIETKDKILLKTLIHDIKNIPTVNCGWSHDSQMHSLLTMLIKSGDIALLKAAFDVNLNDFRSAVGTFA